MGDQVRVIRSNKQKMIDKRVRLQDIVQTPSRSIKADSSLASERRRISGCHFSLAERSDSRKYVCIRRLTALVVRTFLNGETDGHHSLQGIFKATILEQNPPNHTTDDGLCLHYPLPPVAQPQKMMSLLHSHPSIQQ